MITQGEEKLQNFFEELMIFSEKNFNKIIMNKIKAMMAVARILYFDNLTHNEANTIMDANTVDLINVIKPTIH